MCDFQMQAKLFLQFVQNMEQRNRIRPAGDSDQYTIALSEQPVLL